MGSLYQVQPKVMMVDYGDMMKGVSLGGFISADTKQNMRSNDDTASTDSHVLSLVDYSW